MGKLFSLGHKIIHIPTLKIYPVKIEPIDTKKYNAFIFTSANAIRNLKVTKQDKSKLCFCVGAITEKIARMSGYNNTVSAGGGASGIGNVVEDTTPQLGGNLDLFSKTINGTGGISITGVVTATTFIGDGSGLTGIVASGSGVVVKNSGSTVGTAGTINFGDNLSVSPISAGILLLLDLLELLQQKSVHIH